MAKPAKYSPEQKADIIKLIKEMTADGKKVKEIVEEAKKVLKIKDLTEANVNQYKQQEGIRSGTRAPRAGGTSTKGRSKTPDFAAFKTMIEQANEFVRSAGSMAKAKEHISSVAKLLETFGGPEEAESAIEFAAGYGGKK